MLTVEQIQQKVLRLRAKYAIRDGRMNDVREVRNGRTEMVFPDHFSDHWPKPVTSNFIDVVARDLAEVIAPLPAFNCNSGLMVSDTARKFAAKRTKIAHWYVQHSALQTQMFTGCDQYLSYGFLPIHVEPDFDLKTPRLRLEDPIGGYPEFNRYNECVSYTKRWMRKAGELAAEWPEYSTQILGGRQDPFRERNAQAELELIRYVDADQIVLYLPTKGNLILTQAPNLLGKCPVVVAVRPSVDGELHGQFDDVLWVQLARAKMALMRLEAAEKTVQAPLIVPQDVQEIPFGPDAVIQTREGRNSVGYATIDMPNSVFAESHEMDQELHNGARYPEGRQGDTGGASVITGRGIQSLLGGFDTQIKTAQSIFAETLRQAMHLAFEMDEKLWPSSPRNIRGTVNGTPFDEKYVPSKDIAGDFTCDVTYGFAAGMDPSRAVVLLLQLRGDKMIPRDFAMRQLPFDLDVVRLQEQIDSEEIDDAIKQGLFAYTQSIGLIAQQGGDPAQVLQKMAAIQAAREKGKTLSQAVGEAFPQQPPPGALSAAGAPAATGEPAGTPGSVPGGPPGVGPTGLPQGVQPGQAGLPPGGRPSLQVLLAGLGASGNPTLQANVSKRVPTG